MIKRIMIYVIWTICNILCCVSMTMVMPSIFLGTTLRNPILAYAFIVIGIIVSPLAINESRWKGKFVLPRDYVKLLCYSVVVWTFIAIFALGLYSVSQKIF